MLISGIAAWRGLGRESTRRLLALSPRCPHSSPRRHRAAAGLPAVNGIPGGRDSYADIVKVVSPAVVTIRIDGKATAAAGAV